MPSLFQHLPISHTPLLFTTIASSIALTPHLLQLPSPELTALIWFLIPVVLVVVTFWQCCCCRLRPLIHLTTLFLGIMLSLLASLLFLVFHHSWRSDIWTASCTAAVGMYVLVSLYELIMSRLFGGGYLWPAESPDWFTSPATLTVWTAVRADPVDLGRLKAGLSNKHEVVELNRWVGPAVHGEVSDAEIAYHSLVTYTTTMQKPDALLLLCSSPSISVNDWVVRSIFRSLDLPGNLECLFALLKRGQLPQLCFGELLGCAVRHGHRELIQSLCDAHGADGVPLLRDEARTVFRTACGLNQLDGVKALLEIEARAGLPGGCMTEGHVAVALLPALQSEYVDMFRSVIRRRGSVGLLMRVLLLVRSEPWNMSHKMTKEWKSALFEATLWERRALGVAIGLYAADSRSSRRRTAVELY